MSDGVLRMDGRRKYEFKFLDALRGVAILAVMLLHISERGGASGDQLVHDRIWPILSHGYLGVQLFFVLSGYCISAAVYGMRGKDEPMLHFLARRFRRIFPPYWWSILLILLLALGTFWFAKKPWHDLLPLTPSDWLVNTLLIQEPLQAPELNMVYWSLSIELQFYFLMALCLLSLRWAEVYLVAVSITSAILLSLQITLPGSVFGYWQEFACGIAAFYWITDQHRWRATPWLLAGSVAATIGIVWYRTHGLILQSGSGHVSLPLKLVFCLFVGAVLIATYRYDSAISRRRLSRIMAWFGTISYSLYLIHVPLATRVFNLGERATTLHGLWWLIYGVVSFVLVLLAGVMFYRCCERPWLNRRPSRKGPVVLERAELSRTTPSAPTG